MFAVCVTFEIVSGQMEAFLPLMREQARTSLRDEPACHRFDICVDAEASTVFLYELYSDAAAFDTHLGSAHFRNFDAAVAHFIAAKSVRTYAEVEEGT